MPAPSEAVMHREEVLPPTAVLPQPPEVMGSATAGLGRMRAEAGARYEGSRADRTCISAAEGAAAAWDAATALPLPLPALLFVRPIAQLSPPPLMAALGLPAPAWTPSTVAAAGAAVVWRLLWSSARMDPPLPAFAARRIRAWLLFLAASLTAVMAAR